MSYVVSLENYRPGQRYDGLPWTGARIEESATRDGVFVPIETNAFTDPDPDPQNPRTRDFTTALAVLPAGWYRVVFTRGAEAQAAPPVYFPNPGARPTVQGVATLLRARTKDKTTEVGTFTADTRPTATQVETLIDQAVADVQMRTGAMIPEDLEGAARHVTAIRAAMLIESSYLPEQTSGDNTVYLNFRFQYAEQIARLVQAVQLRSLFAETPEIAGSA